MLKIGCDRIARVSFVNTFICAFDLPNWAADFLNLPASSYGSVIGQLGMFACARCGSKGLLKRPKTGDVLCRDCFLWCFEEEVHWTITSARLLRRGDKVAIGASGGKDSTVLSYVMKLLNDRYDYGVELILLSIDEGITGYRDDSLETVKRNKKQFGLPLKVLSYKDLYGWSMDDIVQKIGLRNNCTFCGVFRRQALDRGAALVGANKICTGHNADDMAETIMMNVLRCDIGRLKRCTDIITGADGNLPRFKPFKYAYEKEIVMYAHVRKLDYFSTECKYAPNGYRGHVRAYIKDLEKLRPRSILDVISSGEQMIIREDVKVPVQGNCAVCGYISSQRFCQACILLKTLNDGLPKIAIGEGVVIRRPRSKKITEEVAKSLNEIALEKCATCDSLSAP
ncbi:Cytoplasmic tRNA 2-thiolation protein 1 [Echinococcus granulosus]|uniref:Cytoplasmic tRNA 2-thiolation protein 1 n=1 Tax=Echinococcus granulosus TaxID=6210 RepID=A0A068WES2_ECHGR|nr:Cytoplasmic tRNA 2-thiolation protein 1 [Echinococcus granulosus]CDS16916.1 cytoplasmic tRNA 2 thiolation protein 1 [Echinococcus granulosus]